MNKELFLQQYVTQFLASYMAYHHEDDCMNGHPGKRYAHQPIEDALFCAEQAWEQLQHAMTERHIPSIFPKE